MNDEQLKEYYAKGQEHFWELNRDKYFKENAGVLDEKAQEAVTGLLKRFFDAGFGCGVFIESERVSPGRFTAPTGTGIGVTITSYGSTTNRYE